MKIDKEEFNKRMDRQNAEFAAVAQLAIDYRRVSMTPVVDDDYPEVRHGYESAMSELLRVLKENRPEYFIVPPPPPPPGMDLTFKQVSHISLNRCNRWHPGGINSWSLSDWGVALAGEVGEVCDVIKKLNRVRDGMGGNKLQPHELQAALREEIADVFLYLDLLAQAAGVDLAAAIRAKFNSVSQRMDFPERL